MYEEGSDNNYPQVIKHVYGKILKYDKSANYKIIKFGDKWLSFTRKNGYLLLGLPMTWDAPVQLRLAILCLCLYTIILIGTD